MDFFDWYNAEIVAGRDPWSPEDLSRTMSTLLDVLKDGGMRATARRDRKALVGFMSIYSIVSILVFRRRFAQFGPVIFPLVDAAATDVTNISMVLSYVGKITLSDGVSRFVERYGGRFKEVLSAEGYAAFWRLCDTLITECDALPTVTISTDERDR